jgi:hypothetical protein
MPTLPWTPARSAGPGADALVLGSKLELRHYRDVARFLLAAMKIRKQVHHSGGALGVSLIAQPARKTFWTLSAWSDQDSLDAFVGALPHRDVMRRFHGRLRETGFVTWAVARADLPQPHSNAKEMWRDARARLVAASMEGVR